MYDVPKQNCEKLVFYVFLAVPSKRVQLGVYICHPFIILFSGVFFLALTKFSKTAQLFEGMKSDWAPFEPVLAEHDTCLSRSYVQLG